ncbi:MAG: hypothetical protein IJA89_06840 [Clostridia bacterium]|nr:hypothetical protein [Clostridia bacterium]
MAAKTCQICGKPSGIYPLCPTCFKLRDNGEVIQCPDCKKWHYKKDTCDCKKKTETISAEHKENNSEELTCIICGEPSNGKHFCLKCYHKYKDRSVDIRISQCTDTEILDEYGNLTIKCDDGRKVRSRAEALIYNWLFSKKIRAIYEETIYYKENGESKTLHPDFFLPDYNLYIEYNELTNKPYLAKKEYALSVYKKLEKKVVIMTDKDINDIAACLKPILELN